MSNGKSPAVEVAKGLAQSVTPEQIDAPYGAILKIQPVATPLIQDVTGRIVDPAVPMFYNKEMEREEPNPNHPDYIKALDESEKARGMAVIDAMIMFGLEVVQKPTSDEWINKLKYMERKGLLDLSAYDLNDPYDMEYLYKRYIVANNDLVRQISQKSGVSQEDVSKQEASF